MARSHSHRHVHRRQKQSRSAARVGIAGGVTGVLGVIAAAALIVVVRAHSDHDASAPRAVAAQTTTPASTVRYAAGPSPA